MNVPPGKRFVIESTTVGGSLSSSQYARVQIFTKVNGIWVGHIVPAGFCNPNQSFPFWTGALPGKIVAEANHLSMWFKRGSSTSNTAWMRVVVAGYLEDM